MTNADNNDTPESAKGKTSDPIASFKTEIDSKLSEVTKALEAINNATSANTEALTSIVRAAKPQADMTIKEDDVYDPAAISRKVEALAEKKTNELLKEQRRQDMLIANLSKEYPEINSDSTLMNKIVSAQKALPEGLRNTAEGIEMAILKTVTQEGIVPKSKRKVDADADVSFSGSRSGSTSKPKGKVKVDEATLEIARLMGRDVTDEKVLKGLEEAANRDTYLRYR
jgi:hypothetical protein